MYRQTEADIGATLAPYPPGVVVSVAGAWPSSSRLPTTRPTSAGVEQSLRRLRLDPARADEAVGALRDLRDAGLILHVALSDVTIAQVARPPDRGDHDRRRSSGAEEILTKGICRPTARYRGVPATVVGRERARGRHIVGTPRSAQPIAAAARPEPQAEQLQRANRARRWACRRATATDPAEALRPALQEYERHLGERTSLVRERHQAASAPWLATAAASGAAEFVEFAEDARARRLLARPVPGATAACGEPRQRASPPQGMQHRARHCVPCGGRGCTTSPGDTALVPGDRETPVPRQLNLGWQHRECE